MVVQNVMVTVSSGGPMGSMNPPRRNQRKKKPAVSGSATPATSTGESPGLSDKATRSSPPSKQPLGDNSAYEGAKQASVTREDSGTPYFDPVEDIQDAGASSPAVKSSANHSHRADTPQQQIPTPIPKTSLLTSSDEVITTTEAAPSETIADNAIVLDPAFSARQYAEDPYTALKREVWRPGDGDGKEGVDGHDLKPPFDKRYRFYQSLTGTERVSSLNMPPKFVLLDDKAAYEVMSSDIPKTRMAKFWPFDFIAGGKIRGKRAHRGRAAVANAAAEGDARYYVGEVGSKKGDPYPFRGAKDYRPIIYLSANPTPAPAVSNPTPAPGADEASKKRKATSPASSAADPSTTKKRGHNNQYTPLALMVKHGGAPSQDKGRSRYRPRINTFLCRDASPEWAKDRSKLYGNIGEVARASVGMGYTRPSSVMPSAGRSVFGDLVVDLGSQPTGRQGSLFVEQEAEHVTTGREETEAMGVTAQTRSISPEGLFMEDDEDEVDASRSSEAHGNERQNAGKAAELSRSRRKQITHPLGFMEQMATDPTATHEVHTKPIHDASIDSGSYAIQLEQQLAGANKQVEQLTSYLSSAQAKILQLEAEITHLKGGLGGSEVDTTA